MEIPIEKPLGIHWTTKEDVLKYLLTHDQYRLNLLEEAKACSPLQWRPVRFTHPLFNLPFFHNPYDPDNQFRRKIEREIELLQVVTYQYLVKESYF